VQVADNLETAHASIPAACSWAEKSAARAGRGPFAEDCASISILVLETARRRSARAGARRGVQAGPAEARRRAAPSPRRVPAMQHTVTAVHDSTDSGRRRAEQTWRRDGSHKPRHLRNYAVGVCNRLRSDSPRQTDLTAITGAEVDVMAGAAAARRVEEGGGEQEKAGRRAGQRSESTDRRRKGDGSKVGPSVSK